MSRFSPLCWRGLRRLQKMLPTLLPVLVAGAVMGAAPVLAASPDPSATAQSRVAPPRPVTLSEVQEGALLIRSDEPGRYLPAPLLHTRLDMVVDGMVARGTVTQRFYNPTSDWVEALYAFPLPETAAIDGLRMKVGDRFIEGQIETRARARQTYETAKREGKTATLLEQHRPNLFTNSVANIGPGEEIVVRLAFHQTAAYRDGQFSLRFPTVAPQRYVPAAQASVTMASQSLSAGDMEGAKQSILITAADGWVVQPPFQDPDAGRINPFAVEVRLRPGFPLANIESSTHKVAMAPGRGEETVVSLADHGAAVADRDFVLQWTPDVNAAPSAALFRQSGPAEPFPANPEVGPDSPTADYVMVMLMPPRLSGTMATVPRQVVVVLDISGSMAGPSIAQAKRAVLLALDRLRPGDRFNVIAFNNEPFPLFAGPLPATGDNIAHARGFVRDLEAGGGTEMAAALKRALAASATDETPASLKQIVFVTDGAVSNETQLFQLVKDRLGPARLFTVGVGSAPNGYFMRRAARFGRGTFVQISGADQVRAQMEALFRRIEAPVVTDIAVRFEGQPDVAIEPSRVPDLYHGEPVVVTARLDAGRPAGAVVVSGKTGNEPWSVELTGTAEAARGISSLWARRRIEGLMDSVQDGVDPEVVREAVTEVALAHHLVSRYTSLVAVDRVARRPSEVALQPGVMPVNLPAGWDKRFFQSAVPLPAPRWDVVPAGMPGPQRAAPPSRTRAAVEQGQAVTLPRGATPAWMHLVLGFVLSLLAGLALIGRRRLPCVGA